MGVIGCNDCLICQLHQNFSATLITLRPRSSPPLLRDNFSDTTSVSFRSQTDTPATGRAPPLAN
jgi:hypothetical protein